MRLPEEMQVDQGRVPGHVPVLLGQVVDTVVRAIGAERSGWIVDGTVGAAGHSSALLDALPECRVLGLDQDPVALSKAAERLAPYGQRARLERSRLSTLSEALEREELPELVAVVLDLGASSLQLDDPERGFSFQSDGPLDMRMDPTRSRTAADIVNRWDEADLADLIFHEGGEKRSRRIARAIVEARRNAPFRRTLSLADVVARATGGERGRIHPATRTFQALRRAVNQEGDELISALQAAERHLVSGGVLAVISFHSGEDRIVKRFFQEGRSEGRWEVLTRRPIEAEHDEVRTNPRSRSAKLRAGRRLAIEGGSPS
jgi:16S rRNA (cytosine1402-N4)-methyltransferase